MPVPRTTSNTTLPDPATSRPKSPLPNIQTPITSERRRGPLHSNIGKPTAHSGTAGQDTSPRTISAQRPDQQPPYRHRPADPTHVTEDHSALHSVCITTLGFTRRAPNDTTTPISNRPI